MRAAAEQLATIVSGELLLTVRFQGLVALPVVTQLVAKGLEPVLRLFLLGRVELLLGRVGVVVERAREGGESRRDLACKRSATEESQITRGSDVQDKGRQVDVERRRGQETKSPNRVRHEHRSGPYLVAPPEQCQGRKRRCRCLHAARSIA